MPYTGKRDPALPGEQLEAYAGERTLSAVADHVGVTRAAISRIVNGRAAASADIGMRLGQAFGVSEEFFATAKLKAFSRMLCVA